MMKTQKKSERTPVPKKQSPGSDRGGEGGTSGNWGGGATEGTEVEGAATTSKKTKPSRDLRTVPKHE